MRSEGEYEAAGREPGPANTEGTEVSPVHAMLLCGSWCWGFLVHPVQQLRVAHLHDGLLDVRVEAVGAHGGPDVRQDAHTVGVYGGLRWSGGMHGGNVRAVWTGTAGDGPEWSARVSAAFPQSHPCLLSRSAQA